MNGLSNLKSFEAKEAIVERSIRDVNKMLEQRIEELQQKYNEKLHELQEKMTSKYSEMSSDEIRREKAECLKEIEHIDSDFYKEAGKIIDKNVDTMGEDLKGLLNNKELQADNSKEIDRSVDKLKENVKYRLDYNKNYYINRSDEYGREAIINTSNTLLKAKQRDEETKEKEAEEKLSQEFINSKGEENRYDDYKEMNENNMPLNEEQDRRMAEMNYLLNVYGIKIAIDNGRIVGKDSNNLDLTVSYDMKNPREQSIILKDAHGNTFKYSDYGVVCGIEANNLEKEDGKVYPTDVLYRKNENNAEVSLSNESKMYIYLNDQKVIIYDSFLSSQEFAIDPELKDLKDIINFYKDRTIGDSARK